MPVFQVNTYLDSLKINPEKPPRGNSNVLHLNMLLKLRKPIFKYTLNKYHVHWFSSFKHLKLPISFKLPVIICLYLHDSYITKFDFMIYAFDKLVVAR